MFYQSWRGGIIPEQMFELDLRQCREFLFYLFIFVFNKIDILYSK